MKKRVSLIVLIATLLISCTDSSLEHVLNSKKQEKNKNTYATPSVSFIEPEKDCPEGDRNCNGISDSQE